MTAPNDSIKQVLKFDTNARGFKRAAYFLIILSAATLFIGIYFLYTIFRN